MGSELPGGVNVKVHPGWMKAAWAACAAGGSAPGSAGTAKAEGACQYGANAQGGSAGYKLQYQTEMRWGGLPGGVKVQQWTAPGSPTGAARAKRSGERHNAPEESAQQQP